MAIKPIQKQTTIYKEYVLTVTHPSNTEDFIQLVNFFSRLCNLIGVWTHSDYPSSKIILHCLIPKYAEELFIKTASCYKLEHLSRSSRNVIVEDLQCIGIH